MASIRTLRDWAIAAFSGTTVAPLLPNELDLAAHIRGNTPLYEAIRYFLSARLDARAAMPVPPEPIDCRAILERNAEVRQILARLDTVYRSPVNQPAEDGEPPA